MVVGPHYERELQAIYKDESLCPVKTSKELIAKIEDVVLQALEALNPLSRLRKTM